MNIGISTFHFASNSGAMLQCFALMKKLESLGHNVSVLDYRPDYHTRRYAPFKNPFIDYEGYVGLLKNIYYNRNAIQRLNRNRYFKHFESQFHLTSCFKSIEEWESLNLDFDAIVCGSDQIWNKSLTNNMFDEVYFAHFPEYMGKKISYAASIGETSMEDNSEELIKLLSDFTAISMREKQASEKLQHIIEKEVKTVPDPTLLLKPEEYVNFFGIKNNNSGYILIYFFGKNALLNETVKRQLRLDNIPIISISPYRIDIDNKYVWKNNLGPEEFLRLIHNAEIVITNSFHCSVFSTLFKKKMYVIKNGNRNDRLTNLFDSLSINNVLIDSLQSLECALNSTLDYSNLDEKLKVQRKIGEQFLLSSIGV